MRMPPPGQKAVPLYPCLTQSPDAGSFRKGVPWARWLSRDKAHLKQLTAVQRFADHHILQLDTMGSTSFLERMCKYLPQLFSSNSFCKSHMDVSQFLKTPCSPLSWSGSMCLEHFPHPLHLANSFPVLRPHSEEGPPLLTLVEPSSHL